MARLHTPTDQDSRSMLLSWVEDRLPDDDGFDRGRAIPAAVLSNGRLVAVAVYFNRRSLSIEMAIAADTPRWATPGVITCLLATPFEALGCRRITAIVHEDNARSRRFVEGIGFKREGVMRDAFKDGAAIIYGMTRRRWAQSRWHDGQAVQEAA